MTTGREGGCVITHDHDFAERMRRIRHHGEALVQPAPTGGRPDERTYYHAELGYNYRMSSLHAATGLVQLGKLEEYLEARRRNAAFLTEHLTDSPAIEPPYLAPNSVHSFFKYVCRLRPEAGIGIDWFVRAVTAEGIPVSRRYPTPLPQQPVFRDAGYGKQPCPVAERLSGELFTLLVHPTVTLDDLGDVATAIRKVSAPAGASAQARIREDAPQAIQGILERLSQAVFINKEDVQKRL